MPKKQVRNAFYFFMKDLEPELRREGRVLVNGIADVVPIAHPRWKVLPQNVKERYEKMAKEYKAKMRGVEGDKYRLDNVGNIIADRKKPEDEADKRRRKERAAAKASWTGEDIRQQKFYFINFQYLCVTEEGDYLPCEVGLVEFSMDKGITKHFHAFVEPGRIPTGYRYTCMSHSEDTHQIPVMNFELSDDNYRGLWNTLENFVNPKGELPEYPPFYCVPQDYDLTKYSLEWIHSQSCLAAPNRLRKIYDISGLMVDLYAEAGQEQISQSQVMAALTTNTWDYSPNTRCSWHEEKDCKFCALAIARRYAFAFSDSLSMVFDFKLTEKHLPSTSDDDFACVVLPPSSVPLQSQSSQLKSRGRGRGQSWGVRQTPAVGNQRHFGQRLQEDDGDDDDDLPSEDYKPSLRRPKVPAAAAVWAPAPQVNKPPDKDDASEWPSLGGPPPSKFAGRAQPPDPRSAPIPPASWQAPPVSMGRGIGRGGPSVMRGMTPPSLEMNGQEQLPFKQMPQQQPQTIPHQCMPRGMVPSQPYGPCLLVNPTSSMVRPMQPGIPPQRMAAPMSSGLLGQGRGRGVLGQSGQIRPPVGRGYAPPGMNRVQNSMDALSLNGGVQSGIQE